MALYQNLNHRREEKAARWTVLRHDGFGRQATLKHDGFGRRAVRPPSRAVNRRVELVRPESGAKGGRRGVIRALIAVALVLAVLSHFKPFKGPKGSRPRVAERPAASATAPALWSFKPAEADIEAVPAEEEADEEPVQKREPAKTASKDLFDGRAVALASLGEGRWAEVDAQGYARLSKGPDDASHFGLPTLKGVAVKNRLEGKQWVRRVDLKGGEKNGLFPLPPELSSEVSRMDLQEADNPRLVTHDGVVACLGAGPYQDKYLRLAAVLADLSARGKTPRAVDLSYEGSAVVKLASR